MIVLAVLATWGHSVGFDFVWDDLVFIEMNPALRSLRNIPRMFVALDTQAVYHQDVMVPVFRPLRTAMYAVLYRLGGGQLRPWLFHAANLIWHAIAASLVFSVTRCLLRENATGKASDEYRDALPALLAGLGFAVHPVLSEAICWAKSLDDIMAAVFTLLATWLLLNWRGDKRSYVGAIAAFAAAMYSKESAVPWVGVAGLLFWLYHRRRFWRSVALTAPIVVMTLLALAHRHWIIGQTSQVAPISGTHFQTLIDMFPTVIPYTRLALGVPPFCIDYSYMKGGHAIGSAAVLGGGMVLLVFVALTVWALFHPRWRMSGIGAAWFLLFMLPVSNMVPMMQYMAERFLYLPLAGLFFAAAVAVSRVRPLRLVVVAGIVLILTWGYIAWNRSWIWADELTLFVQTRFEAPPMRRVDDNVIGAVLGQPHMRPAFVLVPRQGHVPWIAVAPPADRVGADWPRIVATLRELERLLSDHAVALAGVGVGLALAGQYSEAVPVLERATALDPSQPGVWLNLGQARYDAGDKSGAIQALQTCLDLDPTNINALKRLAVALMKSGQFESAVPVFDRLIELEPDQILHVRHRDAAKTQALAQP